MLLELYLPPTDPVMYIGHPDWLVKINLANGRIEFSEHYTPEKAAKVFWDALQIEGGIRAHGRRTMRTKFLNGWLSIDPRHLIGIAPDCPFCPLRAYWLKLKAWWKG